MDKKISINTVILVLLILLTLVSLSASAYLYFTYNPLNTNREEEEVNEYEGWNTYTSENVFATIKYPSNWILTENQPFEEDPLATEQEDSKWLMVSTLPGEKNNYESYVSIYRLTKDYSAMNILDVSKFLDEYSDAASEPDSWTIALDCDKDNIVTKWGVQTYKCSETTEEIGETESYYFVLRENIYSISYPVGERVDSQIIEKILNSIVLYPY